MSLLSIWPIAAGGDFSGFDIYYLPDATWNSAYIVDSTAELADGVLWVNPAGGFTEGTWGTSAFGFDTFTVSGERVEDAAPTVPTLTAEVSGRSLDVQFEVAEDAWWILETTARDGETQFRSGRVSSHRFSWSKAAEGDTCGNKIRPGSTLRARAVSVTGAMSDWSEAVAP